MSSTVEHILRALRAQAWERAKGELRAIAATFYGSSSATPGQLDGYTVKVEEFIDKIEDEGLAE